MNDERFYTIGEVSTICNIPIKTLRYYDDIGLVKPTMRSGSGNYRQYCENQILSLMIIRKLKLLGFSLKEIGELIADTGVGRLEEQIERRLELLREEIERLRGIHSEGTHLLERLRRGHVFLDHAQQQEPIALEEIPPVDVLFTRRVQSDYNNADVSIDRWVEVMDLADRHGLSAVGAIILTYHNEPLGQFYQTDCDLEVCLQVDRPIESPLCKRYGGFRAVTAIHVGSHGTIYNTHIQAIKWIRKHKYEISGPISEEYIISPMDVAHEETFLSKVIIPVETGRGGGTLR